jgi:hypothetical protein
MHVSQSYQFVKASIFSALAVVSDAFFNGGITKKAGYRNDNPAVHSLVRSENR